MVLHDFKQAEEFLASHIPKTTSTIFPGEVGLNRAKDFLHLLGDPQERLKIIHVAGTSGKGSTCYLISSLLASQGFKVGLHQSPHLIDVTERFQLNGQIIDKKEFVFYLNKIIPVIEKIKNITYFEILVGLAFYIFNDKKVDYAVMETGLGGWYDGTNVVSRPDKLSVITKIGLDHTAILGTTIEKIALQKAMIIVPKSQVISIYQEPKAEKVIRGVANIKEANVVFVNRLNRLNLIGDYQKENAGLALTAVYYLSLRDKFTIDQKKIKKVFETASFPGRFDVRKINNKTVIFDGAHNPQKMDAFIGSLVKKYPRKKFNFLLAFKKGKDYQAMLKIILKNVHPPSSRKSHDYGEASKIILTSFLTKNQDMINGSEEPEVISNQLNQLNRPQPVKSVGNKNFCSVEIIPDLKKAWREILKEDGIIVVTGSLYLVGEIFKLINTTNTTNPTNKPINKEIIK
jgi:dihydrofolate synthase/folylpolyglutamate synthase